MGEMGMNEDEDGSPEGGRIIGWTYDLDASGWPSGPGIPGWRYGFNARFMTVIIRLSVSE